MYTCFVLGVGGPACILPGDVTGSVSAAILTSHVHASAKTSLCMRLHAIVEAIRHCAYFLARHDHF